MINAHLPHSQFPVLSAAMHIPHVVAIVAYGGKEKQSRLSLARKITTSTSTQVFILICLLKSHPSSKASQDKISLVLPHISVKF